MKNEFRRLPRIKGHGIRRVIVSITFSASLIVTLSGSASAADLPLSPAPASRAVAVSAPALETPSDMRVHAGVPADQTIHATDVDGDPLTFSVNSGPSYMTVTTTDPGSGFATGNIHLAPSLLDAGATTGIVAVYDGLNYRIASFGIAIFPTLERVADMTVDEGSTADQTLTASDSEGYTLSFTLVDGPPFASVTATSDSTGNLHLAPGYADGGHYTSTLSVSDGVSTRSDVFHITVNNQNFPPILTQPEDMHASAGAFSEQLLMASDPDLQPVAFSAVSGHYLSVGTLSPYPGLGFVTITPPPGVTETVQATVAATDGLSSSQKSFEVRIDTENQPPVVHSSPIQIAEGTDPDLQIVATDTDGQRIFATFSNLPLFMTTGTPVQARGGDTLTIPFRLLPKHLDAGVYHPILRVTDLSSTTIDTLTITITEAGFAETSLRLKWLIPGAPLEHEYSTLDGIFTMTDDRFTFESTTGSGANWRVINFGLPWAEGHYESPGFDALRVAGQDTTGLDINGCGGTPQSLNVRRVVRHLDGSISSLWATFQVSCSGVPLVGDLRYDVPGIPITLVAPHWLPGNTNQRLVFQVAAVDTAGDPIAISLSGSPPGSAFLDLGGGRGSFAWTPGRLQIGDFPMRFVATSAGGLADTAVGVPLPFSSSGSSDPDGDTLSYRWTFGDGSFGTGSSPRHAYSHTGPYPISLVVSDGLLAAGDQTLATIQEVDSSRAFAVGPAAAWSRAIQLVAGQGHYCVAIEIPDAPSRVVEIDRLSLRMEVKGLGTTDAVPADPASFALGDANGNGVPDVTACFGSEALRPLFSKVSGTLHALTTIEFSLEDGHGFRASLPVEVIGPDGTLRPLLAPNPLRASGAISFVTTVEGPARLTLFDGHGRRVRTLLDVGSLPTGYHDLPIEARGDTGRGLPSGVYFYRLETREGIRTGRLALIR